VAHKASAGGGVVALNSSMCMNVLYSDNIMAVVVIAVIISCVWHSGSRKCSSCVSVVAIILLLLLLR